MRLLRRRRNVPVGTFDTATGRWTDVDIAGAVDRDEMTLSTYNIWFDDKHAEQHQADQRVRLAHQAAEPAQQRHEPEGPEPRLLAAPLALKPNEQPDRQR